MSGFHGQLLNLTSTMEAEGPLMVIRTVLSSYCKHILFPLPVLVLQSWSPHPSFAAMLLPASLDELIGREQILPTLDFSRLLPLSACRWFFTLWVQKRQLSLVCNFATILEALKCKTTVLPSLKSGPCMVRYISINWETNLSWWHTLCGSELCRTLLQDFKF